MRIIVRSVAVGLCQDAARFVIPENEARAGIPSGENWQALPGNLKILEAFQSQVAAIRILNQNVEGGLDHGDDSCSHCPLPPVRIVTKHKRSFQSGNGKWRQHRIVEFRITGSKVI
jgi:hypothetical protein